MIKLPDLEKERSEQKLTAEEFLRAYNEGIPPGFPSATPRLLREFRRAYPNIFKEKEVWTLGEHRKKFMDWLPSHLKDVERSLVTEK